MDPQAEGPYASRECVASDPKGNEKLVRHLATTVLNCVTH